MNVLVIGSGGREHAICMKISLSPSVSEIFCAPGNPGMNTSVNILKRVNLESHNITGLLEFAIANKIDLTIVGPEVPLSLGIVDLFSQKGLLVIGPSKQASQLESSKAFAKTIMEKAGVPTASYKEFFNANEALDYIEHSNLKKLVIKCDGLAQGKGVVVCESKKEATVAVLDFMVHKNLGFDVDHIIIEDFLSGYELSAFALCDGQDFINLGTACDHKRLRDEDQGPNTGGMGAYAPANNLTQADIETINKTIFSPMLQTMKSEGMPFTGILFAGLMRTKKGFEVVEFNVRLGDPETQAILPLIDEDLVPWLLAAAKGGLQEFKKKKDQNSLVFKSMKSVHVVMTAFGYPGTEGVKVRSGDSISFDKNFNLSPSDFLFYAGVEDVDNILMTKGGRVLGVTTLVETYCFARSRVYDYLTQIHFLDAHYRKDIAKGLS